MHYKMYENYQIETKVSYVRKHVALEYVIRNKFQNNLLCYMTKTLSQKYDNTNVTLE